MLKKNSSVLVLGALRRLGFSDAGDLPTFKKFEREVQKPLDRWLI
jgi:hypothetical protein